MPSLEAHIRNRKSRNNQRSGLSSFPSQEGDLALPAFGPRLPGESAARLGIEGWSPDSVPPTPVLTSKTTWEHLQFLSLHPTEGFLGTDVWLTRSSRPVSPTAKTIRKQRMPFMVQSVAGVLACGGQWAVIGGDGGSARQSLP